MREILLATSNPGKSREMSEIRNPGGANGKVVVTCAVTGVLTDPKRFNVPVTPEEVLATANNISDPIALSYTVASHLLLKVTTKQQILDAYKGVLTKLNTKQAATLNPVAVQKKKKVQKTMDRANDLSLDVLL